MKKFLTIAIIILTLVNSIISVSYANCDMNANYKKLIDFSELINEDMDSITQTIGDKKVTVRRYEWFSTINYYLMRDIRDKVKEYVKTKNRKIDFETIKFIYNAISDFVAGTSKKEDRVVEKANTDITLRDIESLIDKDEVTTAAIEGKLDSLTKGFLGLGAIKVTEELAKKGIKELAKKGVKELTKNGAKELISEGVKSTANFKGKVIEVVGKLMLIAACYAYNEFYIIPLEKKLANSISVLVDINKQIREKVISHQWMGNNVLITAIPTNTSCMKGYAHFYNIDGIHFNKSQNAINWEFAQSECKFLNSDHDECYQEAEKTIECLWENQDDPSKCGGMNPYHIERKYGLDFDSEL